MTPQVELLPGQWEVEAVVSLSLQSAEDPPRSSLSGVLEGIMSGSPCLCAGPLRGRRLSEQSGGFLRPLGFLLLFLWGLEGDHCLRTVVAMVAAVVAGRACGHLVFFPGMLEFASPILFILGKEI